MKSKQMDVPFYYQGRLSTDQISNTSSTGRIGSVEPIVMPPLRDSHEFEKSK